jgi:hypothetical protein
MQPITQHPFNEALKERHENLIAKAHVRCLKAKQASKHAARSHVSVSYFVYPSPLLSMLALLGSLLVMTHRFTSDYCAPLPLCNPFPSAAVWSASRNWRPCIAFPLQALPSVRKAKWPPTTGRAKKKGSGNSPWPSVLWRSVKGRSFTLSSMLFRRKVRGKGHAYR